MNQPMAPERKTTWMRRASKVKALWDGRFRGFRGQITGDVSILLPWTTHIHYWAGVHLDVESLLFLAEHLPSNGVAFDVGSKIGVYLAALSALKGPALRLVGFEPIPTTLELLRRTLVLNHVAARVEPLALSSKEGDLRLTAYDKGMNNFWLRDDASNHPSISVPTRTMDHWLAEHPDLVPDVVKIDVEGHELEVLEGARELLGRRRPALMIECHGAAWDSLGVSRVRIADLLNEAGYRHLRLSNGGPVDFSTLQTTVHVFAI
jgi:FkbM family methyltransferase